MARSMLDVNEIRTLRHRIRTSRFLPATALLFILAIAASLFAGSYTYVLAAPTPHHIPVAVVDSGSDQRTETVVAAMNQKLGNTLSVRRVDATQARESLLQQQIFAIISTRQDHVAVDTAGAAGESLAETLSTTATAVAATTHVPVTTTDLVPLQHGDPRGLGLFYITLAAVIVGFVGAIQLNVNAAALRHVERILFTAAYSLLGGFGIAVTVDWILDAIRLPFVESWLILALTMFTSGMVCSMFTALLGRWAMVPTWVVMVLVGNPSSGGAVSWPMLPKLLGLIGRWLPPGASVSAQHTAVYFRSYQHISPFLVLAGWALAAMIVYWIFRDRQQTRADAKAAAS
ncbi:ABC transporter permease [Nocardia jiangxiensis]|uniref:ABC transporter permease n=1 Tax=Nocardia jiangxiensis TaxID=282685 RepID=A0ABW6SDA0_9NOCA|nr:ABC transporter permease [Nocardia jiangxiensis]